jgi:hypothetical protein
MGHGLVFTKVIMSQIVSLPLTAFIAGVCPKQSTNHGMRPGA